MARLVNMVCGFHCNQRHLFKNYSSSYCPTVRQRNTYFTILVQCELKKKGGGTKMQLPEARVDRAGKLLRERIQVFPFHAGVIPCREAQLMGTIVTWSQREEKAAQRETAKHNHKRQLLWRAAFTPSSHHWQLTALRPDGRHVPAPEPLHHIKINNSIVRWTPMERWNLIDVQEEATGTNIPAVSRLPFN